MQRPICRTSRSAWCDLVLPEVVDIRILCNDLRCQFLVSGVGLGQGMAHHGVQYRPPLAPWPHFLTALALFVAQWT